MLGLLLVICLVLVLAGVFSIFSNRKIEETSCVAAMTLVFLQYVTGTLLNSAVIGFHVTAGLWVLALIYLVIDLMGLTRTRNGALKHRHALETFCDLFLTPGLSIVFLFIFILYSFLHGRNVGLFHFSTYIMASPYTPVFMGAVALFLIYTILVEPEKSSFDYFYLCLGGMMLLSTGLMGLFFATLVFICQIVYLVLYWRNYHKILLEYEALLERSKTKRVSKKLLTTKGDVVEQFHDNYHRMLFAVLYLLGGGVVGAVLQILI